MLSYARLCSDLFCSINLQKIWMNKKAAILADHKKKKKKNRVAIIKCKELQKNFGVL